MKSLVPPTKETYAQVRLSASDKAKIQALADKFAEGNISAWMRHASLQHRPAASEMMPKKQA